MIKVAVVGPESSGKTSLASALAKVYKTIWVPEYAREYLTNLKRDYVQQDLLEIAKGQLRLEKSLTPAANGLLIADTDMHVIRVWSEFKYGDCDPWIIRTLEQQDYHLYLLTYPDIPWEEDPLRENPDRGLHFFNVYHELLQKREMPFVVVRGSLNQRVALARESIDALM